MNVPVPHRVAVPVAVAPLSLRRAGAHARDLVFARRWGVLIALSVVGFQSWWLLDVATGWARLGLGWVVVTMLAALPAEARGVSPTTVPLAPAERGAGLAALALLAAAPLWPAAFVLVGRGEASAAALVVPVALALHAFVFGPRTARDAHAPPDVRRAGLFAAVVVAAVVALPAVPGGIVVLGAPLLLAAPASPVAPPELAPAFDPDRALPPFSLAKVDGFALRLRRALGWGLPSWAVGQGLFVGVIGLLRAVGLERGPDGVADALVAASVAILSLGALGVVGMQGGVVLPLARGPVGWVRPADERTLLHLPVRPRDVLRARAAELPALWGASLVWAAAAAAVGAAWVSWVTPPWAPTSGGPDGVTVLRIAAVEAAALLLAHVVAFAWWVAEAAELRTPGGSFPSPSFVVLLGLPVFLATLLFAALGGAWSPLLALPPLAFLALCGAVIAQAWRRLDA